MKKTITALLLLAIILSAMGMVSCQQKNSYSDSIPCAELSAQALDQIPLDLGYEAYDSEHVDYFFGGTLYNDYSVCYSVKSSDVNEIGIFHTRNQRSADELNEKISVYLKKELEENRAFIESYAPKEIKKLEKAEVRTFGNYVVFAVLDDEEKTLFFDTLEIMLTVS